MGADETKKQPDPKWVAWWRVQVGKYLKRRPEGGENADSDDVTESWEDVRTNQKFWGYYYEPERPERFEWGNILRWFSQKLRRFFGMGKKVERRKIERQPTDTELQSLFVLETMEKAARTQRVQAGIVAMQTVVNECKKLGILPNSGGANQEGNASKTADDDAQDNTNANKHQNNIKWFEEQKALFVGLRDKLSEENPDQKFKEETLTAIRASIGLAETLYNEKKTASEKLELIETTLNKGIKIFEDHESAILASEETRPVDITLAQRKLDEVHPELGQVLFENQMAMDRAALNRKLAVRSANVENAQLNLSENALSQKDWVDHIANLKKSHVVSVFGKAVFQIEPNATVLIRNEIVEGQQEMQIDPQPIIHWHPNFRVKSDGDSWLLNNGFRNEKDFFEKAGEAYADLYIHLRFDPKNFHELAEGSFRFYIPYYPYSKGDRGEAMIMIYSAYRRLKSWRDLAHKMAGEQPIKGPQQGENGSAHTVPGFEFADKDAREYVFKHALEKEGMEAEAQRFQEKCLHVDENHPEALLVQAGQSQPGSLMQIWKRYRDTKKPVVGLDDDIDQAFSHRYDIKPKAV